MEAIHRKELTKTLPVELADDEIREAAGNMAAAVISLRALETDKKTSMEHYKQLMDSERGHITETAELIDNGHRMEEIKCEQIFDYEEKLMMILRLDFPPEHEGRIVESREMTEDELQMEFGDQGAGEDDADPDGAEEPEEAEEAEEPETVEAK